MNRRENRELCMKILYQMGATKDFTENRVDEYVAYEEISQEGFKYGRQLISTYLQNKEAVDEAIQKNSKGWKLERIAKVDLAILRMASTELLFLKETPVKVVINEAVEIGKIYADKDSYSFINGILGSVANGANN